MGERNGDGIGMEMRVKMKSEEWENENEIVNESEKEICMKWDGWKDNCKTHAHVFTYSSTKTHPPSPPHSHT